MEHLVTFKQLKKMINDYVTCYNEVQGDASHLDIYYENERQIEITETYNGCIPGFAVLNLMNMAEVTMYSHFITTEDNKVLIKIFTI